MSAKLYTPPLQFTAVQPFLNEAAASDHDTGLYKPLSNPGSSCWKTIVTLLSGTASAGFADDDAVAEVWIRE